MTYYRREQLGPEEIERLTAATEPWLSYEECFGQIDVVIDRLLAAGKSLPTRMRVHLKACPACYEEAVALTSLVAEDYGLSVGDALERLETEVMGVPTRLVQ